MAKKKTTKKEAKAEAKTALMEILKKHAKNAGVKQRKGETEIGFQERILDVIDGMELADFKKMPKETIDWSNELIAAENIEDDKKTETVKGDKKKVAEAKKKAKEKAKTAKKSSPDKTGKEWKEGSNAQAVFLFIKNAKAGITQEQAVKKLEDLVGKGKVECSNIPGRVKLIFRQAVSRGIAACDGEKYFVKK